MARLDHPLSPPHALPRFRAPTFGALAPEHNALTRRGPMRSRFAVMLFPLLMSGMATAGCGRTEIELPEGSAAEQMNYDVELERDVALADTSVVHVELVAPSPVPARAGLMSLQAGVAIEDVIAAVCPDGSPIVELDATGDEPVIIVRMRDELRAVIWM